MDPNEINEDEPIANQESPPEEHSIDVDKQTPSPPEISTSTRTTVGGCIESAGTGCESENVSTPDKVTSTTMATTLPDVKEESEPEMKDKSSASSTAPAPVRNAPSTPPFTFNRSEFTLSRPPLVKCDHMISCKCEDCLEKMTKLKERLVQLGANSAEYDLTVEIESQRDKLSKKNLFDDEQEKKKEEKDENSNDGKRKIEDEEEINN